ncbi:PEP-CTERM sorting domain-containing protein [Parvularcula sp. ZS-1/3]|uniref:PEP-CTERM sorting domain-containing protein n=1 Tax=Parvularcula mediterranea TaxID=2732508 RepID=A0A7Y3W4L6_9PROT|nr:PEP-CTERM sorting domain-containing protein [Parvularcula mediterranea]NNU15890.1 PEP-CTERM sorting domain-containing protein [Parvularcula mediterranea]
MKRLLAASAAIAAAFGAANAAPLVFDGITFDDGDAAFADAVVSFTPGDPAATAAGTQDPQNAVGRPDAPSTTNGNNYVSLGRGGEIVLQFTDNAVIASGDSSDDLYVFEIGSDVEDTFVEISTDGITFLEVGKVTGGTRGVDIDAFLNANSIPLSTKFFFVKLIDDPNEGQRSGTFVGADINALGAISSTEVPIPAAALLFAPALGLIARRRKKA